MFNTIFIHIGLPKTGSTYIQNGLQVLSKSGALRRAAYPLVCYEEEFSHIGSGNGTFLSRVLQPSTPFDRPRLEACVKQILDASARQDGDLIISSEQLFFAAADRFAVLKELLSPHCQSIKLVIAVRSLRDWTFSVYMQMVKAHGMSADYDEKWLDEFFGAIYFRWFDNLDKLDTEAITLPYRDTGLLSLFLDRLGEDGGLAAQVPEVKVNRSLSADELELLKQVNAVYKKESLSRDISKELIRNWPDVQSAVFPAAGEVHFQRFASRYAQKLARLNGPAMTAVKELLFADVAKAPAPEPGRAVVAGDQRYLFEAALRNIRDMYEPLIKDAASYQLLKKYAAGMERADNAFDPLHYMIMYPDILKPGANPWAHYQNHGRKEGRKSVLVMKAAK